MAKKKKDLLINVSFDQATWVAVPISIYDNLVIIQYLTSQYQQGFHIYWRIRNEKLSFLCIARVRELKIVTSVIFGERKKNPW